MSDFSNLARLVYQRRQKGKRLLIDFDSTPAPGSVMSKEQRLIELVMAKPGATDLELTKELYSVNSATNKAAFRQLRARVQEKLLNHLPFLDYSDEVSLVSRRYETECRTLLYRAYLLISEGELGLCLRLLQRCLTRTLEAEFTDLAEQATSQLALIYSSLLALSKYEKAQGQLERLRHQLRQEQRADQLYHQFNHLTERIRNRSKVLETAQGLLAEMEKLHEQVNSFNTFFPLYQSRISYAALSGSYKDVLTITEQAQQLYDRKQLNVKRFDVRFGYFWSVYAYLRIGQIEKGLQLAEYYSSAFHPTSTNWFYFFEPYLLLALHGQRYNLAARILQRVLDNPSLPKIRNSAAQRWELLHAYTLLILPREVVPPSRRNFRIQLSELTVPEYSRDKAGYNVFILIYQVFQFLRERQLNQVLLRLESLRKYHQRYLKDPAVLRSRTFLRLLLLLPENEFSVTQLTTNERITQLLYTLNQASYSNQNAPDVEIIPYEHLWALILRILQNGAPL